MSTFSQAVTIAVSRERVWRALTDPAEVVRWDTGIVAPIDAPPDYPRPGQHVRWRYRLGLLPLVLHDRPSRVEPPSVLRSSIRLGPFDFDETYTLEAPRPDATHLTAELSVASPVPLLGGLLTRLLGVPLGRATVRTSLDAIQRHCEAGTPSP